MNWRFFVGASILMGGLMLKVAPAPAVIAGVLLAAVVNWARQRRSVQGTGGKR